MGRPKGVVPNGALIAKLRSSSPHFMTQEKFAELTGLSVRKIQDAEAGKRTSTTTVNLIALKLNVPPDKLIEVGRVIKLPGKLEDMTEAEMANRFREIHEQADLTDGVRVMKKESGCVKVTVKMSLEDAKKIDAAFRDGKLTGVLGVSEVPKWWHSYLPTRVASYIVSGFGIAWREASHKFKRPYRIPLQLMSITFSIASLRLGWLSALGLLFAVIGAFASFRSRAGYWLMSIALILSIAGVARWSQNIKRSDELNQERVTVTEEAKSRLATFEVVLGNDQPTAHLMASKEVTDEITRETTKTLAAIDKYFDDPSENNHKEMKDVLNMMIDGAAKRTNTPPINRDEYKIPEGEHRLVLKVGAKLAFNGLVHMPPGTKVEAKIEKKSADKYTVTFSPSIEK